MADPDAAALECPSCGREHPASERFCASCGMPLVYATSDTGETGTGTGTGTRTGTGGGDDEARREQARKIKPQYAEGRLVRVARAKDQIEAEFIVGLLLEEGIPSTISNAIAGYAPLIGSWEILVPESGLEVARDALKTPSAD